jgi:signal transduction histidine kinase
MLRLSHITRQTLGFYRESKHPVEVSIAQLLDDILELQLRRMEFNKIIVDKRYRTPGMVQGFPVELKQVFLNLIGNAVQAMPDGGKLRLHVFAASRRGERPPGTWISVCDTGVGIDAEHARHLFEPFFTTKSAKGTGLGLWISKGIIQKYGGSIRFRSLRNSGRNITCFQIFLPYADLGSADRADAAAETLRVAEPAGRGSGRG